MTRKIHANTQTPKIRLIKFFLSNNSVHQEAQFCCDIPKITWDDGSVYHLNLTKHDEVSVVE